MISTVENQKVRYKRLKTHLSKGTSSERERRSTVKKSVSCSFQAISLILFASSSVPCSPSMEKSWLRLFEDGRWVSKKEVRTVCTNELELFFRGCERWFWCRFHGYLTDFPARQYPRWNVFAKLWKVRDRVYFFQTNAIQNKKKTLRVSKRYLRLIDFSSA